MKHDDLVVGTNGRSVWVFDDLTPVREWSEGVAKKAVHLFASRPAVRYRLGDTREIGTYLSPGKNPPAGAVLHYHLKEKPKGEVTLTIRDAKGQSIRVVDDRSRDAFDAEYDFKAPADGEYQIQIKDRFQHGGWDYAYLLTVAAPAPAVSLSVASDAVTLVKDKPVEVAVTIAKSNGFADTLNLEVEGLPAGFTVETESTDGEKREEGGRSGRGRGRGDNQSSQGTKLKITAKGDEPFHGPVWIKAKVGEKVITANTPSGKSSVKARHVWISYQPMK